MLSRIAAGSVAFTLALPCAAEPPPGPCPGAIVDPAASEAPQALRGAVEKVVAETAQPGKPWSCRGGKVGVAVRAEGGWVLTVERSPGAPPIVRHVSTADELAPLALALLALPEPEAPAPAEPPPAVTQEREPTVVPPPVAASATSDAEPPASAEHESPRWVELRALADLRFAFPSEVVLFGPKLAVAFALPPGTPRHWSLGAFARLGGPIASLRRGPGLVEVDTGAEIEGRLYVGDVQLRAALSAGIAVFLRDLPRPEGSEVLAAPRLATGANVAWPTSSSIRLLVSSGVDVTPPVHERERDARSPLPIVSVGLAAGVEWAL